MGQGSGSDQIDGERWDKRQQLSKDFEYPGAVVDFWLADRIVVAAAVSEGHHDKCIGRTWSYLTVLAWLDHSVIVRVRSGPK